MLRADAGAVRNSNSAAINHNVKFKQIKTMNKIKYLLIGVGLLAATITTQAQTNSPTSALDFPSTAGSWLTTIDYTKYWPTNEIDISVGGLWANNVNWANYLNVQKDIGNFALDAQMDNAGVAGTIDRISGGGGYRLLNRGDLSAHILLNGGYDRMESNGFVEPNLLVRKLLAHGAFMEISLNYDFKFSGRQPDFPGLRIGTGWTF